MVHAIPARQAATTGPVNGHVIGVNTLNCRACPRTKCAVRGQYTRGEVSSITPFFYFKQLMLGNIDCDNRL